MKQTEKEKEKTNRRRCEADSDVFFISPRNHLPETCEIIQKNHKTFSMLLRPLRVLLLLV